MSAELDRAGTGPRDARLTAWVYGRVQGVGFRASTRMRATDLGLNGSAANRDDGSVQVVAEGPEHACRELLDWLEHGRTPGRVTRVTRRWGAPSGAQHGFTER
ncbi:MAG: acylphosphatase [Streptosporangiales bacterium]|nr:acylphosphatase [Streptosporangiales bacterium]